MIPCEYYRKSNVPPMATFLKKSDYFFKNGKSYTDFFLKESRICQCCQKSRYNVIASTACVPSQAEFFQFSKRRKIEKIACRGKFPPNPLCAQKSQNVLLEFLIFSLIFCTNIPRNGTEDCVKYFHQSITERT